MLVADRHTRAVAGRAVRGCRNMSTKMSRIYKKNYSTVSGFSTTSQGTLQCLTGRDPHRSGYAIRASRIVAFLPLKIASACPVRICSGVT